MALTAASTIKEWLDDEAGGPLLRGLVERDGGSADSLSPVHGLPLQQLVALSGGKMPQSVVDELVLAANDGVAPEETEATGWVERITPGRFTGQTVVVTGAGEESGAPPPPGSPARVAG